MLLNELLDFRLGTSIDEEYNYLVINEVINNKEKYPLIYPYISEGVEYDDDENVIKMDYDFGFFDLDDVDCAHIHEVLELNKAFNRVLLRDVAKDKLKVKSVSFGLDAVMDASVGCVQDPYLNYASISYVTMKKDELDIGEEIFKHNIVDGVRYGHLSVSANLKRYYDDYKDNLDEITDNLANCIKNDIDIDNILCQRFDSADLLRNEIEIDGTTCYQFDSYEIRLGDNLIKFYSTERGFDPLGGLFRLPLLSYLTDEQRKLDLVKKIFWIA